MEKFTWSDGEFRVTYRGGVFNLAQYLNGERYWHFLGEFGSMKEAQERAALIAKLNNRNAARQALSRAVNRAIAEGSPVYTNKD